mgnify:CR=1 FL=1
MEIDEVDRRIVQLEIERQALRKETDPASVERRGTLEGELAEYFAGERTKFGVPLDLSRVKGFRADVLVAMQRIPYGKTASYSELAASAGRPASVGRCLNRSSGSPSRSAARAGRKG